MFDIHVDEKGQVILSGRLYASQVTLAGEVLSRVTESAVIDFENLEYISAAGIELLLSIQKRLNASGHSLSLVHLDPFIRDVFRFAGFDDLFDIR